MQKTSKLPLIIGSIFVLLAGVGAWFAISSVKNTEDVVVAKHDLPAYTFVSSQDVEMKAVPKGSIEGNDLTKKEFEDMNSRAVITSPILTGQRIDLRNVINDDNATFAVVLPDERVIAANSTATGAAVGTIQAGDVVDVNVGSDAGTSFAKVICIATEPSGCKGVMPAGTKINAEDSKDSDNEGVLLLLAVPASDASDISGQSVTLSLNPFCRVDNRGYFTSPRMDMGEEFLCEAPSNRQASNPPADEKAETNETESE